MTQKGNTEAADRKIMLQRLLWGTSGSLSTTALMLAPDFQTVAAVNLTSMAVAMAASAVLEGGKLPPPRPASFIVGVAVTPHILTAALPNLVQDAREERWRKTAEVEKAAEVQIPGFQHYNARTNTLKLA